MLLPSELRDERQRDTIEYVLGNGCLRKSLLPELFTRQVFFMEAVLFVNNNN